MYSNRWLLEHRKRGCFSWAVLGRGERRIVTVVSEGQSERAAVGEGGMVLVVVVCGGVRTPPAVSLSHGEFDMMNDSDYRLTD
jgi:hypothetical protein